MVANRIASHLSQQARGVDTNFQFRAFCPKNKKKKSPSRLTACVTCVWAGVDHAWEQEKLEARKMLENAAESHTSGARCVSPIEGYK
jgi:hypothetical protein